MAPSHRSACNQPFKSFGFRVKHTSRVYFDSHVGQVGPNIKTPTLPEFCLHKFHDMLRRARHGATVRVSKFSARPRILGRENAGNLPLLRGLSPLSRAILAVTSTCLIIKASELLISAGVSGAIALLLLMLLAFFQWAVLDGRLFALALALVAAVGGPLAELPLMWLGAWHYTAPDYWPLAAFGLGATSGAAWAGLSMTTGPCYFAVTTDAIALGRLFASWRREP